MLSIVDLLTPMSYPGSETTLGQKPKVERRLQVVLQVLSNFTSTFDTMLHGSFETIVFVYTPLANFV